MKNFAKLVALGAALAVAPVAFATPIKNGFVVVGTVNDALAPYHGGSITFADYPGITTSGSGAGTFSALPSGTPISFNTGFYNPTPDVVPLAGEELFDFTLNGTDYTFNVLTFTVSQSTGVINLYGMLQETTGTNVVSLKSMFSMANNNGQLSTQQYAMDAFTGTFTVLPEPNSLLLLGTGLLLGSAMMMRKRRTA